MPTIVLGQDEVDCFAAWVSAEAGLPEHIKPGSDLKVHSLSFRTHMQQRAHSLRIIAD